VQGGRMINGHFRVRAFPTAPGEGWLGFSRILSIFFLTLAGLASQAQAQQCIAWYNFNGAGPTKGPFASPQAACAVQTAPYYNVSPATETDVMSLGAQQGQGASYWCVDRKIISGSPSECQSLASIGNSSITCGVHVLPQNEGAYWQNPPPADCGSYYVAVPATPLPSVADSGRSCPACANGPDPVNPSSGNEFLAETDFESKSLPQSLSFRRYYNSLDTTASDMGPGWSHSFSRRLTLEYTNPSYVAGLGVSSLYSSQSDACVSGWAQIQSEAPGLQNATASFSNGVCTLSVNGAAVTMLTLYSTSSAEGNSLLAIHAVRDDGHVLNFSAVGSNFYAEAGLGDRLVSTASGGYQLIDEQDNVETYDGTGKLLSVADRAGNTQTLSYSPSTGLLSSVSDNFGHTLTFGYDSQNRLQSVTAPDGEAVQYAYDAASHLWQVTNLDSATHEYYYTDPNWPDGLSSVVDENGQTEFSLTYDSQGRVLSSTLGGVSSSMSFTYNSNGSTTVTDPIGAVRTFQFQEIGDHELSSAVTGAPCFKCGYVAATSYDSGGFPASKTDFNGNVTTYVNDETRGLETSRTEASGTATARTITTQWSSTYRLPTLISEYAGSSASGTPIRKTSFSYDGTGNLLTKTITDPATGATRTWTYTYDSYGRMLTAEDPDSNTTTYQYYTCTSGYQCGELQTVTDALGHVTTYNTYDANGRPLTITDPNGTVTTLTYDPRGRLTSRNVGGETTGFSYYPTGLLEQVTLPDGSSLSYTYDPAHRLNQVSDGLGNKIVYTLDAMGNRIAENTYDPSGALHRTHTRVINTLNEIYQEINAVGTSAVTTTYAYDNDGNATSIEAPLSRNTGESYDALNRLTTVTDPANGVTTFGYDAEDDLTSVKDPRGLTTSYGYDGFGDLTSQTSPDTGSTTDTYDSAGNLHTSTDARGAVATYGYDALNRVTSIAYSLAGTTDQTLSYTYDQGGDGVGHLTGASDANHSMSFSYDALGELTGTSQTVAGINRSVGYAYTEGDLASVTTPSGQIVSYGYNANHQVTSVAVNGTTVLSNVSYEPFGPVDGWTWGNGNAFTRSFDGDGDITGITTTGSQEGLSYDDASRISGITNTASGSSNWTYGYDPLDRLTGATSSSVNEGWTYDANGNRLSETGTSPSTYSISTTSNEITGITGTLTRTYGYDAAGNSLSDSTDTDTYNDAGRLKTITNASGTTTFIYNALGQMIEASGPSGTTLYVYDQAGHLLGEYDGSGNLIQETVWLGDIPVATLRPNGSSVAIYYVVSDQLDTPREVVRPSDNALMWTWFTGPFGVEATNTNPQGAGNFTYDLRFPGQIAGAWGSTLQNDYRDYDPAVGRFVESDPIGLSGGSYSTYEYGYANPLLYTDPTGLDANTWTYGEIRNWAISGPNNFAPPLGLPDAKASIGAVCTDATCNNVDGSSATAPADQAAWNNIVNANGGTDRSGGGTYMCVGTQQCWFVHMYYTCIGNKKVLVQRPTPLKPSGEVTVDGHTIYFYRDPLKGWDTEAHYRGGCGCNR
jgi:RHS repeat-associated protein